MDATPDVKNEERETSGENNDVARGATSTDSRVIQAVSESDHVATDSIKNELSPPTASAHEEAPNPQVKLEKPVSNAASSMPQTSDGNISPLNEKHERNAEEHSMTTSSVTNEDCSSLNMEEAHHAKQQQALCRNILLQVLHQRIALTLQNEEEKERRATMPSNGNCKMEICDDEEKESTSERLSANAVELPVAPSAGEWSYASQSAFAPRNEVKVETHLERDNLQNPTAQTKAMSDQRESGFAMKDHKKTAALSVSPLHEEIDLTEDPKPAFIKVENLATQPSSNKTCSICFQTLQNSNDDYRLHLLSHLESYEGKSTCPTCRADCTSYEKMVDHFMMVHGEVQRLVCPHPRCVRSFRIKRTLDMHLRKHLS